MYQKNRIQNHSKQSDLVIIQQHVIDWDVIGVCVRENDSEPLFSTLHFRSLYFPSPGLCKKKKKKQALPVSRLSAAQTSHLRSSLFSLSPPSLSQQQRKEREMVRQQEKGPHRRLDDMRREEDRRLAEREQVTNHGGRWGRRSANQGEVGVCPTGKSLWRW